MNDCVDIEARITAIEVPLARRLAFLPALFGPRLMVRGESMVYDFMRQYAQGYNGGFWHFYELSNGARFMAADPDLHYTFTVPSNYSSALLSGTACGIVVTLFALSHLSFSPMSDADNDRLATAYEGLRDFAGQDSEASAIFAALD